MSHAKWSRRSSATLIETPYYRFRRDRYVLPRGGESDYFYIDIPGSAMVVPEFDDGTLMLVRQHRYLHGRASLEFPAGGTKRGSTNLQTAHAELREEAGLEAQEMEHLGTFAPYNGASNELCEVFVARALTAAPPRPDATEELFPERVTLVELQQRIVAGELWDGMTLAALQLYLLKRAPARTTA